MTGLAVALAEGGLAGAVIVESAETSGTAVDRLRTTDGEFALLVIGEAVPALERAMLLAAIGILAVELAPARRIGAVVIEAGAAVPHIVAGAMFLQSARSTTGQILTIAGQA